MTKDEILKMSLDAMEGADMIDCDMRDAINAIKEALAQPEQEPFMASYEFKQYGYYKDGKGTLKLGNIPATQPPQRTWVGLTHEERKDTLQSVNTGFVVDASVVALAIEAKLREKNNG